MSILITGGSGYIGESLFSELNRINCDSRIINYDNLSRKNYSFFINNKFESLNAKFEHGDLLDTKRLLELMKNVDTVIHLAGLVTTPYADHTPHLFEQNNHWGTSSLMTAIERSNIKRVIFLSTATVYGNLAHPVDEQAMPQPETFYCVSKYQAEKQLQRIEENCEVFILRSGNVYGYNTSMRMDAFINKFMFEAHYFNKIRITGAGNQYRPVIHVDKLAFVLAALVDEKIQPGTYNVAQHNFSINDVAKAIQSIYPKLDMVYSSQNMPMRSLQIKVPCRLLDTIKFGEMSFEEELQEIKKQFSFTRYSV